MLENSVNKTLFYISFYNVHILLKFLELNKQKMDLKSRVYHEEIILCIMRLQDTLLLSKYLYFGYGNISEMSKNALTNMKITYKDRHEWKEEGRERKKKRGKEGEGIGKEKLSRL